MVDYLARFWMPQLVVLCSSSKKSAQSPTDQEKGIPRVPPECPQALICNMHKQYPIQSNRNQYHHNANS